MRIHHLNCGSMCPPGGRLMDGVTPGFGRAHLVCHCLLVETDRGLVLVDTGLGMGDVQHPKRLAGFFRYQHHLPPPPEETALHQVRALGFKREDVRHIVLTHLDFDHAGGIEDFPQAHVHVLGIELDSALQRSGFIHKRRYRPQQWDEGVHWVRYRPEGERWFGFEAVRAVTGLPPDILIVPLAGHTVGHAGIAIDTGGGWLLHCGDAYFYHGEMDPAGYHCTPGLRAYQKLMEVDRMARLANQQRLRALAQEQRGQVSLLCTHDPVEFETYAAQNPSDAVPRRVRGLAGARA